MGTSKDGGLVAQGARRRRRTPVDLACPLKLGQPRHHSQTTRLGGRTDSKEFRKLVRKDAGAKDQERAAELRGRPAGLLRAQRRALDFICKQDQNTRVLALPCDTARPHTLALLPSAKRQVFCVGDRLKMVKHQAWATTIVAPKLVG